jgi:hypothetical protein
VLADPLTGENEIRGGNGLSDRKLPLSFTCRWVVKWYLSEIYAKLYVTSRTQAIARARELNLLN